MIVGFFCNTFSLSFPFFSLITNFRISFFFAYRFSESLAPIELKRKSVFATSTFTSVVFYIATGKDAFKAPPRYVKNFRSDTFKSRIVLFFAYKIEKIAFFWLMQKKNRSDVQKSKKRK